MQNGFARGAPSWSELIDKARVHQIPLAPCYGMTETASQIVTLKPERFLIGDNSSGQVLPHATVKILNPQGEELAYNQRGRIVIQAASLALGYYPECFADSEAFQTDDAGFFDQRGNLNLVGRLSHKLITGGESVFPTEVESAIRSTGLVDDVAVIGLSDQYWGQILTAVYVPQLSTLCPEQIKAAIQTKIARFKHPKLWIPVERLPRSKQGKVNRQVLLQIALEWRQADSVH